MDSPMDELFDRIQGSQIQQESTFVPFYSFYKQRGTYPSFMKGNFHGRVDQAILRNQARFFDNNIFTTSYIMTILLEVFSHSGFHKPSEGQMLLGMDSFLDYKDKNRPTNHSIYSFWPLKYNPSKQFWSADPANTFPYLEMMDFLPVKEIAYILRGFGLKDIDEFLEYFHADHKENEELLFLPADQDTSSIHMAFGATLRNMKEEFPKAWAVWSARNSKTSSVLEAFKQYSYRPFSGDPDSNSIDPRTYFYLREFLHAAKEKGEDVALITTWAQTLSQQRRETGRGATMVRGINNVCLGVVAHAVLAITRAVTSGVFPESLVAEDPLMRQIYLNSSSLLAFQLDRNLTGRPDLALMYYPTRVQFEWMVSRTLAELEVAKARQGGLSSLLQTVYETLQPSARAAVTDRILEAVQADSAGRAYFEDFLGTADLSPLGEQVSTGEDRIFCTALAVNTLLNVCISLIWDNNTPAAVKETVSRAVQWLAHNALSGQYKPHGAFFSSSFKWSRTLPYRYPGNRYEFINGTEIFPWSRYPPDHRTSYMVRGYIPPGEYRDLLGRKQFGLPVPRDFHGFNADHTKYMWIWDSEPYTYSVTLLALAKYRSLVK
ncbi:hypothetical protein EGW08_000797 [Elysia chlorotica]|uniref:Uncharacterized protein n=1 Tax=Elysia chlorotica TaxID=188477 RepID=A0A3S1I3C8_ELYCH|nr:hypothetical protein EGW08_000797 [Elysia chlorotica]